MSMSQGSANAALVTTRVATPAAIQRARRRTVPGSEPGRWISRIRHLVVRVRAGGDLDGAGAFEQLGDALAVLRRGLEEGDPEGRVGHAGILERLVGPEPRQAC